MNTRLVSLILVGLAVAVVAADKADDDLASFKGNWKVSDSLAGGNGKALMPFSKSGKTADAVQVAGDKVTFLLGKDKLGEFSVKLDPSKSPATIDFIQDGKTTYSGIYELKGDTLRLCILEGKERPTDITGKKESAKVGVTVVALTLQRAK
jgi:uncharacterized protein (TIGR03067 family)